MSFKIKMPGECEANTTYSMLIYGQPGVGKTTAALSAKNPILIDFERGMRRVSPLFQRPSISVNNYGEVMEFLASKEVNQFDTIVIDSMTKLIDSMTLDLFAIDPRLKNRFGGLTLQGYGALKSKILDLNRELQAKGKNVIFVAHSKTDENERGEKIVIPDMGPGAGGLTILADLEIIGYVDVLKGESTIHFNSQNGEFSTKNSFALPSSIVIRDPEKMGKNTFVQDVIDKHLAAKNEKEAEMQREYKSNLEDMCLELASIRNCDDCNKALEYFQNEARYKNFMEWKAKLYEKAKSLGLDYNKETGAFEGKDEEENVVDNSIAA